MGSTNWKSEVAFMVIAPVLVGLGVWAFAGHRARAPCPAMLSGREGFDAFTEDLRVFRHHKVLPLESLLFAIQKAASAMWRV